MNTTKKMKKNLYYYYHFHKNLFYFFKYYNIKYFVLYIYVYFVHFRGFKFFIKIHNLSFYIKYCFLYLNFSISSNVSKIYLNRFKHFIYFLFSICRIFLFCNIKIIIEFITYLNITLRNITNQSI